MTARIALCLCLLTGCADTLPADTLTRFAHTLEALKHGYRAMCDGRESADECVYVREVVNGAIDKYSDLNASLKGEP